MQEQTSVLSNKHSISRDKWVVGMLRKPKSENSHHVLLVVEGRNIFNQALLRRYDLYIDKDKKKDEETKKILSEIVIRPDMFCAHQDAKSNLDLLINSEEYYVKAWEISAEKAIELHANILITQKNPPIYLLSGDISSFSCDKTSKKIEGHSCYTWARYELKKIGIAVPKNPLDYVIAVPDFVIKPDNPSLETGSGNECRIL